MGLKYCLLIRIAAYARSRNNCIIILSLLMEKLPSPSFPFPRGSILRPYVRRYVCLRVYSRRALVDPFNARNYAFWSNTLKKQHNYLSLWPGIILLFFFPLFAATVRVRSYTYNTFPLSCFQKLLKMQRRSTQSTFDFVPPVGS